MWSDCLAAKHEPSPLGLGSPRELPDVSESKHVEGEPEKPQGPLSPEKTAVKSPHYKTRFHDNKGNIKKRNAVEVLNGVVSDDDEDSEVEDKVRQAPRAGKKARSDVSNVDNRPICLSHNIRRPFNV